MICGYKYCFTLYYEYCLPGLYYDPLLSHWFGNSSELNHLAVPITAGLYRNKSKTPLNLLSLPALENVLL